MNNKIITTPITRGESFYALPNEITSKIDIKLDVRNKKMNKYLRGDYCIGVWINTKRKTDDLIRIEFN